MYEKEKELFAEMMDIIAKLRGPEGCLWDRKQTLESLAPNIIEEAKEVSDAVEAKDMDNLCEELGDLLMVILMKIEIAKEKDLFTYSDVLDGAIEKFTRRHPHVFGDVKVNTSEEALSIWKKVKQEEKEENNKNINSLD
ncbi:unnamed protein product [marine sediment metagenome]|uniref:NTP pyrophosphohydrolase MazG-like domain-containing protein n=1 Tax=marine sediment metagenome TaxID=412755 RepID=X1CRD4_9ZZZZ